MKSCMFTLLFLAACAPTSVCGTGTHDDGGVCVADAVADTAAGDTGAGDTDSAGDTDTGGDSDSGGYSGVCAPLDAWTGVIPPSLYTRVPYDASYDAGLSAIGPEMYTHTSGASGGQSWLITGATVSAIGRDSGGYLDTVYIEDAAYSVIVHDDMSTTNAEIGDMVGFATDSYWSLTGERQIFETAGWTVMSSNNPVYVADAGANPIDYSARLNQVTHAYGQLERVSASDCGTGYACYILAHEGTEDLVRVDVDLNAALGLGANYDGGLCAELVAPVSAHDGASGEVVFYDVGAVDSMRTWTGP